MRSHEHSGNPTPPSLSAIDRCFPQLSRIQDTELRERVGAVWLHTWEKSGWKDLFDVPYSSLVPDPELGLISHTRTVVNACLGLAQALAEDGISVEMDVLVAAALLHDVCKLLELNPETRGKGPLGESLPHGLLSVDLARNQGVPVTVLHAIAAHTPALATTPRSVEAVILHYADYTHYNCLRLVHGLSLVHIH